MECTAGVACRFVGQSRYASTNTFYSVYNRQAYTSRVNVSFVNVHMDDTWEIKFQGLNTMIAWPITWRLFN